MQWKVFKVVWSQQNVQGIMDCCDCSENITYNMPPQKNSACMQIRSDKYVALISHDLGAKGLSK